MLAEVKRKNFMYNNVKLFTLNEDLCHTIVSHFVAYPVAMTMLDNCVGQIQLRLGLTYFFLKPVAKKIT